jgi:hypothetical protein
VRARICREDRNVMQSGRVRHGRWRLMFLPENPMTVDPLMGWTGASDTLPHVMLDFPSRERAIAFAQSHGIAYEADAPVELFGKPKSYADNFRFGRKIPWSH